MIYPLTVATCLLWTLWRVVRTIADARQGRAARWTPLRTVCDLLFAPRPQVDVYHAGMFKSPNAAVYAGSTCGVAPSTQRHPLLEAAYRRSEEQRQQLITEVASSLPPSEPQEQRWYDRFVDANINRAVDIETHGIDVRDWPQLDGDFSL